MRFHVTGQDAQGNGLLWAWEEKKSMSGREEVVGWGQEVATVNSSPRDLRVAFSESCNR